MDYVLILIFYNNHLKIIYGHFTLNFYLLKKYYLTRRKNISLNTLLPQGFGPHAIILLSCHVYIKLLFMYILHFI